VPAAFRKDLQNGVVLRKDREGCVELLPRESWEAFLRKLQAIPRTDARAQRWVTVELAAAVASELDKQGRVLLSQDQKHHANLATGAVVITGALDRLKVWSSERWAELQGAAQEEDLDAYIYQAYQI
jgi:division/cell wall cluster transcriptional repressor MraZ